MAPKLVNTQHISTPGTTQFSDIDATGFQVDDFLVIALQSEAHGGGYNWTNEFSGAPTSHKDHVTGPFGDSTDVFGHIDATMVDSGKFTILYRHKITSGDLVDTGGGTGALTTIGFRKNSASEPYSTDLVIWQMRGVTYSSKTSTSFVDFSALAADPETLTLTGSVLTKHQAYFSMGAVEGNGTTTVYAYSASDDRLAPDFAPLALGSMNWTFSGGSADNGSACCANSSFGVPGADATSAGFTVGAGGDSTASADCALVIVTFVEDLTPAATGTDAWAWVG